MATIDHKTDLHTLPTEPYPTSPLARPYDVPDDIEDSHQRLLTRLAGINLAVNVLTGLLANSETFRDQQTSTEPPACGEWPLPPSYVEGIFLAIFHLSHYAESLSLSQACQPT